MLKFLRYLLELDDSFTRDIDSRWWSKIINAILRDTKLMATVQESLDKATAGLARVLEVIGQVDGKLDEVAAFITELKKTSLTVEQLAQLEQITATIEAASGVTEAVLAEADALDAGPSE